MEYTAENFGAQIQKSNPDKIFVLRTLLSDVTSHVLSDFLFYPDTDSLVSATWKLFNHSLDQGPYSEVDRNDPDYMEKKIDFYENDNYVIEWNDQESKFSILNHSERWFEGYVYQLFSQYQEFKTVFRTVNDAEWQRRLEFEKLIRATDNTLNSCDVEEKWEHFCDWINSAKEDYTALDIKEQFRKYQEA